MMTLHSDSTALDRPDSVILPPGQPITLSVCLISAILNPIFPSLTWTNPSFIDSFVISLCKESIWSWIFLSNTLLTAHPLTDWSFSDWKSSKICSVWFYIWKSVTQYGARSPCWRLESRFGWSWYAKWRYWWQGWLIRPSHRWSTGYRGLPSWRLRISCTSEMFD